MKAYIQIAAIFGFITFFNIQTMDPSAQEELDKALLEIIVTGKPEYGSNSIFNVADDIIRLVKEGANPNAKNSASEPVLSAFINVWIPLLKDKPELSREVAQAKGIIIFLLANKADIDALNAETGMPALVDAIRQRSLWAVKLLVDKGADLSIRDRYDGKTALDIAREIAIKELEKKEGPKEASWWQWRTAPSIEEKDITDPIYLYLKEKVDAIEIKELEEEFAQI